MGTFDARRIRSGNNSNLAGYERRTGVRSWKNLLAFGVAAGLIYHATLVAASALLGLVATAFLDVSWWVAVFCAYLGIRLIVEGLDMASEFRRVKCPKCRRKVMTSMPVPCGECGGAARLAGPNQPKPNLEP